MEIIVKDVSRPKLTVTPTRQTLKIIPLTTEDEKQRLMKFSEKIINQLPSGINCSIRGSFHLLPNWSYEITLMNGSREIKYTFRENGNGTM